MDIGAKLRAARTAAGLTQEQTAEVLGVSRQTISNWENARTYPDIVSVVRMSDLYAVSLDHLLKEEAPMSSYLDYLEESTSTVRSKNRLSLVILLSTYLLIWAAALIAFWVFHAASGSNAMGYSILYLWVLLPAATFLISLLLGRGRQWGRWKWLLAPAFGVLYMLADYATFSAANMAASHKLNLPAFELLPIGTAVSLAGMALGAALGHLAARRARGKG